MHGLNNPDPSGKCHVFVDFDGTIASIDTTDALLEQFAQPEWQSIEEDWKAGKIGSRECMVRQIDLVRATPATFDRFIDSIQIDHGFSAFVAWCKQRNIAITVVSDGIDRTIAAVLKRNGLDLPYRANRLRWSGDDRWALDFPNAKSDCRALSGNCKCQFAEAETNTLRIMIGDGRSDFCVSERVEFVLAKASLLQHAASCGLPHAAFNDFHQATALLAEWLTDPSQRPRALQPTPPHNRAR
jgi:2-hydroxy-3-keto-5-methylthiopentenyl-1-phosphate phosphatase